MRLKYLLGPHIELFLTYPSLIFDPEGDAPDALVSTLMGLTNSQGRPLFAAVPVEAEGGVSTPKKPRKVAQ